ncbi:MAG TPA: DUF5683 domain-containing protein [Niabella sp.]|nr:DUF5683 domain-containing protein [Niabella sp.]HOZ97687.1 DUF5683 domain-containing protein [Niabella sp.]HQW13993.1 DUF5683 domain-containing protein [Niabella sp.]HQX19464.1 DUF5683 domain-containing protein [Niabella sp.]HQX40183.1 DUF5683 domain-containing protein [Niabella sp.]
MQFATKLFILFLISLCSLTATNAQVVDTAKVAELEVIQDSASQQTIGEILEAVSNSTQIENPNSRRPSAAALRSAVLPGWGQVYNKKIWKVPIVYAALGATGGIFINNLKWYRRTRYAYIVANNIQQGTDSIGSIAYNKIYERLRTVFFEGQSGIRSEDIRTYRDSYRRYVDYTALYFVIFWALNVVDATVDAHLSSFDISPNLSFHVQPGYSEMARTNGLSLVLRIK